MPIELKLLLIKPENLLVIISIICIIMRYNVLTHFVIFVEQRRRLFPPRTCSVRPGSPPVVQALCCGVKGLSLCCVGACFL